MARAIAPLLAAWLAWAPATQAADPYLEGIQARLAGNFNQAVQILSAARAEAQSAHARARASGELGVAYLQLGRVGEARESHRAQGRRDDRGRAKPHPLLGNHRPVQLRRRIVVGSRIVPL